MIRDNNAIIIDKVNSFYSTMPVDILVLQCHFGTVIYTLGVNLLLISLVQEAN